MTVDTKKYLDFVAGVTSMPSQDSAILQARIDELVANGADIPHLLTAALGLTAESGEFTEVVKKIILQGKPYNEDNIFSYEERTRRYLLVSCSSMYGT